MPLAGWIAGAAVAVELVVAEVDAQKTRDCSPAQLQKPCNAGAVKCVPASNNDSAAVMDTELAAAPGRKGGRKYTPKGAPIPVLQSQAHQPDL